MPIPLAYDTHVAPFLDAATQKATADSITVAAALKQILDADPRHVRNIKATSSDASEVDLLDLLSSEFKVMLLTDDAGWYGALVTHMQGLDIGNGDPDDEANTVEQRQNASLRIGFDILKGNLQITNRPVRCHTVPEIGYLTTKITEIVDDLRPGMKCKIIDGVTEMTVRETMDAVTGGRMFAGITELELQQLIDDKATENAEKATAGIVDNGRKAIGQQFSSQQDAEKVAMEAAVSAHRALNNLKITHMDQFESTLDGRTDQEITDWYADLLAATQQSEFPAI